jgi:hypothetical protein
MICYKATLASPVRCGLFAGPLPAVGGDRLRRSCRRRMTSRRCFAAKRCEVFRQLLLRLPFRASMCGTTGSRRISQLTEEQLIENLMFTGEQALRHDGELPCAPEDAAALVRHRTAGSLADRAQPAARTTCSASCADFMGRSSAATGVQQRRAAEYRDAARVVGTAGGAGARTPTETTRSDAGANHGLSRSIRPGLHQRAGVRPGRARCREFSGLHR